MNRQPTLFKYETSHVTYWPGRFLNDQREPLQAARDFRRRGATITVQFWWPERTTCDSGTALYRPQVEPCLSWIPGVLALSTVSDYNNHITAKHSHSAFRGPEDVWRNLSELLLSPSLTGKGNTRPDGNRIEHEHRDIGWIGSLLYTHCHRRYYCRIWGREG